MKVLGIDGGGTKTLLALSDEHGHVRATLELPSFSLASHGESGVQAMFVDGIRQLFGKAGFAGDAPESIDALCYGVPGFGEFKQNDAAMRRIVDACLPATAKILVNDSQVAWAGSFAMRPGINVVAGTGAIAFGVDPDGNTARCGGWGFTFSDEGSGYWLGRKMLELFCKQADGRIPVRGPLYEIARAHFGVVDDYELIELAETEYLPHRDRIASLQRVLLQAAQAGDQSAIATYRDAGQEIALNARGVLRRLSFDGSADVSYSGGIFQVGALVMDSFTASLHADGCTLTKPIAPPWIGALMIALTLLEGDPGAAHKQLLQEGANPCHL